MAIVAEVLAAMHRETPSHRAVPGASAGHGACLAAIHVDRPTHPSGPYTFIVGALSPLIVSLLAPADATDIFPNIEIQSLTSCGKTPRHQPGCQTNKPKTVCGRFHLGFKTGSNASAGCIPADSPKAVPFRNLKLIL